MPVSASGLHGEAGHGIVEVVHIMTEADLTEQLDREKQTALAIRELMKDPYVRRLVRNELTRRRVNRYRARKKVANQNRKTDNLNRENKDD